MFETDASAQLPLGRKWPIERSSPRHTAPMTSNEKPNNEKRLIPFMGVSTTQAERR